MFSALDSYSRSSSTSAVSVIFAKLVDSHLTSLFLFLCGPSTAIVTLSSLELIVYPSYLLIAHWAPSQLWKRTIKMLKLGLFYFIGIICLILKMLAIYLLSRNKTLADVKYVLLVKLLGYKRYGGLVNVMDHDFIGLLTRSCPKRCGAPLSYTSTIPSIY